MIQDELRKATEFRRAGALPAAVEAALAPQPGWNCRRSPRSGRSALRSGGECRAGAASVSRHCLRHPLQHVVASGSGRQITVNLKDVTVPEAMAAMRELYGYEYRIDGNRIYVQPLTAQTRFYSIAYPASLRQGKSELRVISGSIADAGAAIRHQPAIRQAGNTAFRRRKQSSRQQPRDDLGRSDFWGELQASIGMLIGCSVSASSNCRPTAGEQLSEPDAMSASVRIPAC
jgi:MSHA biogenesis protein MshL